jgi:hypothetical protein
MSGTCRSVQEGLAPNRVKKGVKRDEAPLTKLFPLSYQGRGIRGVRSENTLCLFMTYFLRLRM